MKGPEGFVSKPEAGGEDPASRKTRRLSSIKRFAKRALPVAAILGAGVLMEGCSAGGGSMGEKAAEEATVGVTRGIKRAARELVEPSEEDKKKAQSEEQAEDANNDVFKEAREARVVAEKKIRKIEEKLQDPSLTPGQKRIQETNLERAKNELEEAKTIEKKTAGKAGIITKIGAKWDDFSDSREREKEDRVNAWKNSLKKYTFMPGSLWPGSSEYAFPERVEKTPVFRVFVPAGRGWTPKFKLPEGVTTGRFAPQFGNYGLDVKAKVYYFDNSTNKEYEIEMLGYADDNKSYNPDSDFDKAEKKYKVPGLARRIKGGDLKAIALSFQAVGGSSGDYSVVTVASAPPPPGDNSWWK